MERLATSGSNSLSLRRNRTQFVLGGPGDPCSVAECVRAVARVVDVAHQSGSVLPPCVGAVDQAKRQAFRHEQ